MDPENLPKFGSSKYYIVKIKKATFFVKNPAHSRGTFLNPGVKIFDFLSRVKTGGSIGGPKCLSIMVDGNDQKE
jgi:hypothetical protein